MISMNFRASEAEMGILKAYAAATGRAQSDIIREFIRSLEDKLAPEDEPPNKKPKK